MRGLVGMEPESILRRVDELAARHDRDEDAISMRIAAIEQRMARVETRGDGWERQIQDILSKMEAMQFEMRAKIDAMQNDLRSGIRDVFNLFTGHIDEEYRRQRAMLVAMLTAAAGGAASVVGWFVLMFMDHVGLPGL